MFGKDLDRIDERWLRDLRDADLHAVYDYYRGLHQQRQLQRAEIFAPGLTFTSGTRYGFALGPETRNARPRPAGATDQPNWKGSAGNDPPITPLSVVQWIISSAEI